MASNSLVARQHAARHARPYVDGLGLGRGLLIVNMDDGSSTLLARSLGGGGFPDWSPDGGRIVFAGQSSSPDCSAVPDHICDPSAIYAVDLKTGLLRKLTEGEGSGVFAPVWSPDGSRIAFLAERLSGPPGCIQERFTRCLTRLVVVMYSDGLLERIVETRTWASVGLDWSPDGRFLSYVGSTPGSFDNKHASLWVTDVAAGLTVRVGGFRWDRRAVWLEPFASWSEDTLRPSIAPRVQPALDLIAKAPADSRVGRISELLNSLPGRITFSDFVNPALAGVYDPVSRRIELDSGLLLTDTETIAAELVRLGSIMLDHTGGVLNARPSACLEYNARAVDTQLDFWVLLANLDDESEGEQRLRLDELAALRASDPSAYTARVQSDYELICADLPFGDIPWSRPWDGD